MQESKPLLSICIPTYNRAQYLEKSLTTLVSQPEMNTNEVEIVISDNASTDETEKMVRKYQKKFKNIIYSKNPENVKDKNFPIVISKASGIYRKLCNDTVLYETTALSYFLDAVKSNIDKQPVLFFLNNEFKKSKKDIYFCNSFDDFVSVTSFYTTWIASFGIWESDFEKLKDKFDGCELSLWQTKVLLWNVHQKESVIYNIKKLSTQGVEKKDLSYGLYQVFYENFLGIYLPYVNENFLSNMCYEKLRKELLFEFFLNWIVTQNTFYSNYTFNSDDYLRKKILLAYKTDNYLPHFKCKLYFAIKSQYIKRIVKKYFIRKTVKEF